MSKNLIVGAGAIILAVLAVGMSLLVGTADISVREVVSILAAGREDPSTAYRIVWDLRMPRGLLAFFVGGGLAVVGVGMQALVRNPLAEPYILGVSSGASAGAALFYLGFLPSFLSPSISMPVAAFAGGLGSLLLVYLVARTRTHISVTRLLLAGVAMSALMGAVTAFITFASPDPARLRAVLFWLMGSLGGARWDVLWLPAAVSSIGFVVLLMMSRGLDAMLLGEEHAWNLGMPVERLKHVLLILAAFITGPLVAAVGVIGFVGLIIPHIVRMLVGVRHAPLLVASYFLGGAFIAATDSIARSVLHAQELPIGVLTAICGVPFFLWLLRSSHYRFG